METMFNPIYQLPGGLFSQGAPIFVAGGKLLESSGGLYVSLRMKNIDPRNVVMVKVKFIPFAEGGILLDLNSFHEYEVAAEPNGYFGEDELISVPADTCAFGAAVTEVEFDDGSVWTAQDMLAWHVANDGYNPQAPVEQKKNGK